MKKFLTLALAAAMLLSLAACGKKAEEEAAEPAETVSEQQTDAAEPVDGDPAEYGREFWEAKYPGENICPFGIEENGVEHSYYWVSGFNGYDGTIESWLAQPFNWNGWHKTADGCIVNADETLKITDDWANGDEGMSSFCTVTTEAYDKDSVGSQSAAATSDAPELAVTGPADLVCVENEFFAAKYEGDHSDDDVFFANYGEDSLYYVLNGFLEDGGINYIKNYSCLYYFFADEASYRAALESVPAYDLRQQNDEHLYFTVKTASCDDDNYADMMDTFGQGYDYRHPHFFPVNP